ncbi:hypothetical protein [Bradyrhizobium sp. SZCCHNS2005]|uniref:hypothetical protein n=1 Tax=Bradyrhizobium sp. SZCCHNS2005 TaxID=3057303 RepID=UPI0028E896D7|nr:hypothetical protein [Bradyrhizobium sp. SZCCHNS2005]
MPLKIASAIGAGFMVLLGLTHPHGIKPMPVALYLEEHRRAMSSSDYRRSPGAGVLLCRDDARLFQKAAAAWLIGSRSPVMMNAHHFRDSHGLQTRSINDCCFQIGGKSYDFGGDLQLGIPPDADALHITDDWALARLAHALGADVAPQPVPKASTLTTSNGVLQVTVVSPAGHGNYNGPHQHRAMPDPFDRSAN